MSNSHDNKSFSPKSMVHLFEDLDRDTRSSVYLILFFCFISSSLSIVLDLIVLSMTYLLHRKGQIVGSSVIIVVSLLFSDLIMSVILVMTRLEIIVNYKTASWLRVEWICTTTALILVVAASLALLSVIALALERTLVIVFEWQIPTSKQAGLALLAVLFLCSFIGLMPLLFTPNDAPDVYRLQSDGAMCMIAFETTHVIGKWTSILAAFMGNAMGVILIVSYGLIARKVYLVYEENGKSNRQGTTTILQTEMEQKGSTRKQIRLKRDVLILRKTAIFAISYCLCWEPMEISIAVSALTNETPSPIINSFVIFCAATAPLANSLLLLATDTRYIRVLKDWFRLNTLMPAKSKSSNLVSSSVRTE